ncbi:hypothetical protein RvY_02887 [Ramazzottius varieornatus]|uniref:Uncharacterized protein n=1 Tax=Ramazzottius varieornatus TaxID=947166 RepID=A0A1D1UL77_RAMVA|nr:hypothetical protein RvY_02887 [Ramazzottius varieornatus]
MDIKRLSAGEVYFLRMSLDRRPARSYDDLRTVDGIYYSTFSEAAVSMGLVAKNGEADLRMQEAIECLRSPAQLRSLFVLLINEGAPAADLYCRFLTQLAKDFTANHSLPEQEAENNVLTDISM